MTQDSNAGLHPEDSFAFRKISDWLNFQIQKLKAYNDCQEKVSDPYVPILPDFMERGSGMTRWGFNPDGGVAFIRFGPEIWLLRNSGTSTFVKIWIGGLPGHALDEVPSAVEAIRNWLDGHDDDWSPIPASLLGSLDLYDPAVVIATAKYPDFTRHPDGHRGSKAPLELRLAHRVIYWLPSLIQMMRELLSAAESTSAHAQAQMRRHQGGVTINDSIDLSGRRHITKNSDALRGI